VLWGVLAVSVAAQVNAAVVQIAASGGVVRADGTPLQGRGFDSESAADLVQCIYAGPNAVIDPPGLDGLPTGDDALLALTERPQTPYTVVGEGFPFAPNAGKFTDDFDYGYAPGSRIYLRAWNASDVGSATHYGDSALYALQGVRGETHDFGTWSVSVSRARHALALTANPFEGGVIVAVPAPGADGLYGENQVVTLRAEPSAGYTFGSWSGNASGATSTVSVTMDGPKSVAATFQSKRFALTIDANYGGTVTATPPPDAADGKYAYGASVTLTATPISGYVFEGWGEQGTARSITVQMTSALTVQARFGRPRYTLATAASPSGAGTVATSPSPGTDGKYAAGTEVVITAQAASGYVFSHWAGAASGTSVTTRVTISEDVAVTAHFEPRRYVLSIAANPAAAGSISANPAPANDGTYAAGTTVKLTATPAVGFGFTAWGGDAGGTQSTATLTMNSDRHVTASFAALRYTLALAVDPATGGTLTATPAPGGDGKYAAGTEVTIEVAVGSGYVFEQWYGDLSATANPISLTMTSNKGVTAVLRPVEGCRLTSVDITSPRDGQKLVIAAGASAPLLLEAAVSCPEDTGSVAFYVDGAKVGAATSAPYRVTVSDVAAFGAGTHSITAKATSKSSNSILFEDTVEVLVEEGSEVDDTDVDGMPDNPFLTLEEEGDTWLATVVAANNTRTVGVTRWQGSSAKDASNIVFSVQDGDNLQRLTVEVPRALLGMGETGMIILQSARTLESLLGAEEAALVAVLPAGGLARGGRFVHLSIIVSSDGGATYTELGAERLSQHPVHLTIGGVLAPVADKVDVLSHPSFVDSDPQTGLVVRVTAGTWSGAYVGEPTVGASDLSVKLTSLSLLAPFNVTPGTPSGTGCAAIGDVAGGIGITGDLLLLAGMVGVLLAFTRHRRRRPV
jgi:hypothetical protein